MLTLALSKINRAQLERNADALAVAIAVSLPWSTSATAVLLVLWLIALIPTFRLSDLHREAPLTTLAGGLPVALWSLAVLGMLWSDVGVHERLAGLSGYHKLLVIPLLFAQFRRSDRAQWVLIGFLLSSVVVLLVSWLPTIIPGLEDIAWRKFPGVPVKDYITQSSIFQLCGFGLAYLAVDEWRSGRPRRALVLATLALLFFANIIYLVSSRTALVLMPILILLLGFRLFGGWRGLIAAVVVGIVVAAIVWNSSGYMRGQLTSIITVWNSADNLAKNLTRLIKDSKDPVGMQLASGALRLEYYRKSIAIIREAPIIGHGTGTIRARFEDAATGKTGIAGITTKNPHQQTFAVAIQLGFIGFALLWAMWVAHLLLFRGAGIIPWFGLLVVVQNILSSSLNTTLFDFAHGWIYVFGVGVLGGAALREAKYREKEVRADNGSCS